MEQPPNEVWTRRPERDEVITKDEIIDLRILLETTSDVEEFLGKVE